MPVPGTFTLRPEMEADIYDGTYDPGRRARAARKTPWYLSNKFRNAVWLGAGGAAAASAVPALFGGGGGAGAAGAGSTGAYSSPGAYSGLFGGVSAPGTGATAGAVSGIPAAAAKAGAASKLSTLGSIFNSDGFGLGVNAVTGVLANRSARQANAAAMAEQARVNREAIALQREQLEQQQRNADLDRADAKALNDAINKLKERELASLEEQRAYERQIMDEDQGFKRRDYAMRDKKNRILADIFGWGL